MVVAFIPARKGSKSIPNKNIKRLLGKPLIYWCLSALQQSVNVDKIVVATDCSKIISEVKKLNLSKISVYNRDPKNAQDSSTTESVMLEYLSKTNSSNNDIFLLVQATSPLTKSSDFDNALNNYKKEKIDSLLSCVRNKSFYWNENGTPINYNPDKRPRRQKFKGVLQENGAFYISTVSNILTSRKRISGKIGIYEMEVCNSIDIDEDIDWLVAEKLLEKRLSLAKHNDSNFYSDV